MQIRKRSKAAINNDKSSLLPAIKAYIGKWQDTDNARQSNSKSVKIANGAMTSTSIGKDGYISETRPRGTNNRYLRLEIAVKMLNRDEIKCRSNDTKRNYDNIQIEVHARAINIANDGILKLNDDDKLKKCTIENLSSVNRRLQFTKKTASVPKMNRQTKSVSQGQSLAYTLLKSNLPELDDHAYSKIRLDARSFKLNDLDTSPVQTYSRYFISCQTRDVNDTIKTDTRNIESEIMDDFKHMDS